MAISFIIPAYNEEKYIEQCVRSVLEQKTSVPYEVIVVDNNSTDHTAQIVQKNFPSVHLVKEMQQGMTKARNRGAKEAKNDILVFLDSDSMLPQGWLQKAFLYFEKNPKLSGISAPSKFYDLPRGYKFVEFISFKILFPFFGEFLLKIVLKRGALWNGAMIAVRRELFERVGRFNEHIVFYGEDADLAQKMMRQGEIAFLQDLWVFSSARRLLKGNPIIEGIKYIFYYVWFLFTNKSAKKSYEAIR